MSTVFVLILVSISLGLYLAGALLVLHWDLMRKMDFFDLARRVGPATIYGAIALASLLLALGVAPEWRLPPVVLAMAMTALGVSRDLRRHLDKRRNR